MFRRIDEPDAPLAALTFEGRTIAFRRGDTLAGALLAAGVSTFRINPADGAPRGPHCMMGLCFDCLVEIDGRQNQQACMTTARDGMIVRRQSGARTL